MAKYYVTVDIAETHGTQRFEVEAESEEEAVRKWKDEGGEFVDQDIEVIDLNVNNVEAELAEPEPDTENATPMVFINPNAEVGTGDGTASKPFNNLVEALMFRAAQ